MHAARQTEATIRTGSHLFGCTEQLHHLLTYHWTSTSCAQLWAPSRCKATPVARSNALLEIPQILPVLVLFCPSGFHV